MNVEADEIEFAYSSVSLADKFVEERNELGNVVLCRCCHQLPSEIHKSGYDRAQL